MKRLTLIRHAKSSWGDPDLADFDRPLNKRGRRSVEVMGRLLASEGFSPDRMLSSPAKRALTTARGIADAIGYPVDEIVEVPEIYEAAPSRILGVIRSLPDDVGHAVLFGHNPGFGFLANELLYRDEIDRFVTCGVAELSVLPEHWAEVGPDTAALLRFRHPRMFMDDA